MNGDMNDIFQKLNTVLDDPNMSDNLKNILNNFSAQDHSKNPDCNSDDSQINGNSNNSSEKKSREEKTSIPDIDLNTLLNIKKIMDSINSEDNDARSNLLLSLKPYLAESKKEKVDQYVKFLRMAKIIEILNPIGGDKPDNE